MHLLCPMVLCMVSATMCTMARGGSLLLLLTLAWSGEGSGVLEVHLEEQVNPRTVVVEIQDVNQPYNCSAFFDSLEVGFQIYFTLSN